MRNLLFFLYRIYVSMTAIMVMILGDFNTSRIFFLYTWLYVRRNAISYNMCKMIVVMINVSKCDLVIQRYNRKLECL